MQNRKKVREREIGKKERAQKKKRWKKVEERKSKK